MYQKIKEAIKPLIKDEELYKQVKAAIKEVVAEFRIKDYEKLVKDNPEDIKKYLMENYPNQEAQFVAFILEEYNEENNKIFLGDMRIIAHKIATIAFGNGELGKDLIKRKLSASKYRLLNLE